MANYLHIYNPGLSLDSSYTEIKLLKHVMTLLCSKIATNISKMLTAFTEP